MRHYIILLLILFSSPALAQNAVMSGTNSTPATTPGNAPPPGAGMWFDKPIIPHKNPASLIQPGPIAPTQLPVTVPGSNVVIQQSTTTTGNPVASVKLQTQHRHHRVCTYTTANGVLANNPAYANSRDCPPVNGTFIPIYTDAPVAVPYVVNTNNVPVNNVASEIIDNINNDEFIIDNNRIVFTNLWHGLYHQSECSVAAGYVAANPATGVVLMTQPSLSATPVLIYAPTASGPLRVTQMDLQTGLLTLQSQNGLFPVEDANGNQIVDDYQPRTLQTDGGVNYSFSIDQAKFVQP